MGWLWTLLLNGSLAGSAYVVCRDGLRQPQGAVRVIASAVVGWMWLTLGMQILGSFGAIGRGPLLGWCALGMVIAGACWGVCGRSSSEPATTTTAEKWGPEATIAFALSVWSGMTYFIPSLLLPVKVVSDGPIYHLYFAARWWKSGRLDLVAAPFGENAATYFPANGDVWFAWLITGSGGEQVAKVGQVPFLLLAGLASFSLAREVGARRGAALLATCVFLTTTPLLLFSFEPNVDTLFVAGYLCSAVFLVRYVQGEGGLEALMLAGLSAGLTLGTKATGVVFVPPLLVLGGVGVIWRVGFRSSIPGIVTLIVSASACSVFWYARNAWLTGNPLYPLHVVALGRVWLAGWYGPEVMRMSPYYLPAGDWRAFVDMLLAVLDPRLAPLWGLAVGGAWFWGRGRRRTVVTVIAAMVVVNVGLYWLAIPYRTQQRFMLQALGLAVASLALVFDRARAFRVVGLFLLTLHVMTAQSWPFAKADGQPPWDLCASVPNAVPGLVAVPTGSSGLAVWRPLACGFLAAVIAWSWARVAAGGPGRRKIQAGLVSLGCLALAGLAGYPWGLDDRLRFFPIFPEYIQGWIELDQRSGARGSRVAYAGNALPYYLLGSGLRNDVRYVNVDAHPGWLLHDYHRTAARAAGAPVTWNHPRPGWDRTHPDYDAWIANLRAEGIQMLVVNRVNPVEGPHNVADRDGFPIERVWAESHPERFVPLYGVKEGDPQFRLYRLRGLGGG